MTLYLDTSSLVKLYVDEPGADEIHALVGRADVVVTSVLAYPEARATFARRRRERLTTASEHRRALQQFDSDWPRFVAIHLSHALSQEAGRLAERLHLRGADAVHLASFAGILASAPDDDIQFSCADRRLGRAARSLG